jgi:hypothetical protein
MKLLNIDSEDRAQAIADNRIALLNPVYRSAGSAVLLPIAVFFRTSCVFD